MPEKPDPKVLRIWLFSNAITYGILFLILLVGASLIVFLGKGSPWLFAIPAALVPLALFTFFTLKREYDCWRFAVTPESLEITKGWLYRQQRFVARDRIQHIDLNSGPLDRRFGLMQVVIHTAGADVGIIPGLTPERAERLRADLLEGRSV